jgi:hypothetical protein
MRILPVPDRRRSVAVDNECPPAEQEKASLTQGRKTQLRTGVLRRDAAHSLPVTGCADTALSNEVEDILFGKP